MDDGFDFYFVIAHGIGDNGEFYTCFSVFEMDNIVHKVILTVFHTSVKNKMFLTNSTESVVIRFQSHS